MPTEVWQTVTGQWIAQENDLQVIAETKEDAVKLLLAAEGQKYISIKN